MTTPSVRTFTRLDPKALELATAFHREQRDLISSGDLPLIKLARTLGISVYQSQSLGPNVFARMVVSEDTLVLTLNAKEPLIRKRFILAKAMARKLLKTPTEQCTIDIGPNQCTLKGPESLENQTACALLVTESRVLAAYVVSPTMEQFGERLGLNLLCAELLLASHMGDSAVRTLKHGALQSQRSLQARRSGRRACKKDTDWTSELVSLGVGAALSAIFGF